MPKVFIEGKEIIFNNREEVLNTDITIKNQVYTIKKTILNTFSSDIFSYEDFDVLCSNEVLFNETYLAVVLFNDTEKVGWRLLSINGNLEVNINRLSSNHFLIIGDNKNTDDVGQISFCETMKSGEVQEVVVNFNSLVQSEIIQNQFVILNFVEDLETFDGSNEYIHTVSIYKSDGKIFKNLIDEKTTEEVNYTVKINGNKVEVYNQDNEKIVACDIPIEHENAENDELKIADNYSKPVAEDANVNDKKQINEKSEIEQKLVQNEELRSTKENNANNEVVGKQATIKEDSIKTINNISASYANKNSKVENKEFDNENTIRNSKVVNSDKNEEDKSDTEKKPITQNLVKKEQVVDEPGRKKELISGMNSLLNKIKR